MKKMFVRQIEPVGFSQRQRIRFVPDQIISQHPLVLLHCKREPGRNK
jgi:hypothetical protein